MTTDARTEFGLYERAMVHASLDALLLIIPRNRRAIDFACEGYVTLDLASERERAKMLARAALHGGRVPEVAP